MLGVRSRTDEEDERRTVAGGDMRSAAAGGGDGVRRDVSGDSIVGRVGNAESKLSSLATHS